MVPPPEIDCWPNSPLILRKLEPVLLVAVIEPALTMLPGSPVRPVIIKELDPMPNVEPVGIVRLPNTCKEPANAALCVADVLDTVIAGA